MVSPKLILGLIILLVVGGAGMLVAQWWIAGGIVLALGAGLYYFWWRMNQLLQVTNSLQRQDWDDARKRLGAIRAPEKLNPYSRTYYYFFQGIVETQGQNWKAARQGFKTALDTGYFRSVDEKATALMYMAQLDMRGRNTEGARRYLREARELDPSDQIREQINMIVKQSRIRL
ncbi:MAG: hypothetical protein IT211_08230 [Armatimonadetes bacterium]|nr:hypothetical protein [Armatimonadota bacterium]